MLSRLARRLKEENQPLMAASFFKEAVEQTPWKEEAYEEFIEFLVGSEQYVQAIYFFKSTPPKFSISSSFRENILKAYVHASNPEEGLLFLAPFLVEDPDNPALLNYKGVFYDQQNKHEKAQLCYLKGLEKNKDHKGLLTNLGISLVLSGDIQEGLVYLNSLVKLPSVTQQDKENLAWAQLKLDSPSIDNV